jgi:hypothetical protein
MQIHVLGPRYGAGAAAAPSCHINMQLMAVCSQPQPARPNFQTHQAQCSLYTSQRRAPQRRCSSIARASRADAEQDDDEEEEEGGAGLDYVDADDEIDVADFDAVTFVSGEEREG